MRAPYYLHRRQSASDSKRHIYYVQFVDASGHRGSAVSTGCTTRAAAERWAQERVAKGATVQPTLEDFAARFFDWQTSAWIRRQHAKGRRFSESVAKGRQGHLDQHILPHFGKVKVADLDQKSIEDWLATLPLANQTRNHILYTFRIVLREAKLAGVVRNSVLADAEPFGAGDAKRRDIFTLAELRVLFPDDDNKLVEIWGEPERAVAFLLLASTGIRSGECRALRWLNVLEGRALYVDSALDKLGRLKGTKTESTRVVLLPVKAQNALQDWRGLTDRTAAEDFVFQEGGAPHGDAWLRRTLPGAMKRAKVEPGGRTLVVHSFRHTFVTLMQNFTTKENAKALSGHSTEDAFRLYSHPSAVDLLKRLEAAQPAVEALWAEQPSDKSPKLTPGVEP